MGIFEYVTDLYAAMSVQIAEAEEPQKDDGKNIGEAHLRVLLAIPRPDACAHTLGRMQAD
jgi:hypothetical protein